MLDTITASKKDKCNPKTSAQKRLEKVPQVTERNVPTKKIAHSRVSLYGNSKTGQILTNSHMTDEAVHVLYFSHKPLTLNWHKQAPHPSHLPIDTDGFRKRVKGLLLRGTSGESHAAGTEIKPNLSLRGMGNTPDLTPFYVPTAIRRLSTLSVVYCFRLTYGSATAIHDAANSAGVI
jgi:hypothetical protein